MIRRALVSVISDILAVALDFLILQDKHNTYSVVKYKITLYSLRNRLEQLANGSLIYLFLKLVQINYIFSDNERILYIISVFVF